MKRFIPLALIIAGLVILCAGFMYDVLFAGIPYQDPTPELQASYNLHSQIASTICWSGFGVFAIGGLTVISQIVRRFIFKKPE